jgi:hypothetical protein
VYVLCTHIMTALKVITADDDIIYPPHTLFELIVNSRRLPNAALGHLGFRLPRQRGVPLEHGHFHYREGCNETSDQVLLLPPNPSFITHNCTQHMSIIGSYVYMYAWDTCPCLPACSVPGQSSQYPSFEAARSMFSHVCVNR